jgi:penicillin-binding protein A
MTMRYLLLKIVKNRKFQISMSIVSSLIIVSGALSKYSEIRKEKNHQEKLKVVYTNVKTRLNASFTNGENWPEQIEVADQSLRLNYTFDSQLTKYIKKLLKRYRSDYSSIIVLDNNTGQILSAIGYERNGNKFNNNLAFSSTHPSASLFKMVTAANLIENSKLNPKSKIQFRGRGTTLYKYQLKNKKTRWTRKQTLERAFAFSNNVIFGKASINHSDKDHLYKMAQNFGFNEKLMDEVNLAKSNFKYPENNYNLAELASGFNRETTISPVHAAMMSSIVANNGIMKYPRIITNVVDQSDGKEVLALDDTSKRVISPETSDKLFDMMTLTVNRGTARKSFNKMRRKIKRSLDIGGKTGTITGGIPFGKRDWFTAFAKPKQTDLGNGISISVMNVNINKWYVKSAYLAQDIIEYYYKKIFPRKQKVSESPVINALINEV